MKEKVLTAKIKNTWTTAYEAGKDTQLSKIAAKALSQLHEMCYLQNAIRTNPGGAYAHMMTHEVESEVPAVVPNHRRV